MSNTTQNANEFPLPPPGLNYTAALGPMVNLLIIGTVWSAMLIPLLVALFVFSTRALRRKPVFAMNVLAIFLGVVEGSLNLYAETKAMLNPSNVPSVSEYVAFGVLVWLVPFYVELILLFRLVVVYPPSLLAWPKILLIFGPLAAFKLGRLINISITFTSLAKIQHSHPGLSPLENSQLAWQKVTGAKVEWIFQPLDNLYSSALFLLKLRKGNRVAPEQCSTYRSRLKALFWISASNFVFPCLLSVAQLVFLFIDDNAAHGIYIVMTNNYVQIIGVLLATVWATGNSWVDNRIPQSSSTSLPPMTFREGKKKDAFSSSTTVVLGGRLGESSTGTSVQLRSLEDHDAENGNPYIGDRV